MKYLLDPKFLGIYKIIKRYKKEKSSSDYDRIFIERLKNNPSSLTLSYWNNHPDIYQIEKYFSSYEKILDFGCGSGQLDIFISRSGKIIHGIDISCLGITIANYLRSYENEKVKGRLKFSLVDITRDYNQEKYDAVWSNHVFEHIVNPEQIINGLKNWVNDDAIILITVPLGLAYDDPDHCHHFFSDEDIRNYYYKFFNIITIDIDIKNKEIHLLANFKK